MTIKTSRRNLTAASADEAAVPHALPAQAGKVLARRHLYMSAAVVALTVAGGAGGIQPVAAAGIKNTTPTHLNVTDLGSLLNNIPRSASGGDVVTTSSDTAGVDVQVRQQLGQQIPFLGWVDLGDPFDSVGDIDINVEDVDAQYPGQKGINATNASGNINIGANDIVSDAIGVNAQVKGFPGITILGNTIGVIPGIGNISIDVGDVTSANGGGINAETGFGTIDITSGNVSAGAGVGVNATTQLNTGIDLSNLGNFDSQLAAAFSGDGISIDVGNVDSTGTGINAVISGVSGVPLIGDVPGLGSLEISAGNVTSDTGDGINAATGLGTVLIQAGNVDAAAGMGVNATTNIGISLSGLTGGTDGFDLGALLTSGVTVDVGNVSSEGIGINAEITGLSGVPVIGDLPGIGSVNVSAGDVTSADDNGINATTGFGLVTVSADNVEAAGSGVNAVTGFGAAIVTVGDVNSRGQGINAQVTGGNFGDLSSILGSVPGAELLDSGVGVAFVSANDVSSTLSGGINAEVGLGAAGVIAHDVDSAGTGINAKAGTGLAFAYANDVSTTDAEAHGINVEAGGVAVGIATGDVSTEGDDAYGVRVVANPLGDLGPVGDLIDGLGDLPDGIGDALGGLAGDALSAVSNGVAIAGVNNVTTAGSNAVGVSAEALDGIAGVIATGDVETTGDASDGIHAYGGQFAGVIANNVSATGSGLQGFGDGSRGIVAEASDGPALVVANSVISNAAGITASADNGFVGVAASSVETQGDNNAAGIDASIFEGDAYIAAGSVKTVGDNSDGIHAETQDGSTYVVAGDVTTSGTRSTGIVNVANGTSVTLFNNVHTTGNLSPGVIALDPGSDVFVAGQSVATEGNLSPAIVASSVVGDVTVLADQTSTVGNASSGILAQSSDADVFIGAGSVATQGRNADAITAGAGGDAKVVAGTVSTSGRSADGVNVAAGNDALVIADSVSTSGRNADAVTVGAAGDASVVAHSVSTEGNYADGVNVGAANDAVVVADSVSTSGRNAAGIDVGAADDAVVVAGTVSTSGRGADAVTVRAGDDATVVAQSVSTAGNYAAGIDVLAGGDAVVVADTVSTLGRNADAVTVRARDDARVIAKSVSTEGNYADGIDVAARDDAVVVADTVSTLGRNADAVTVRAGDDASVVTQDVSTNGRNADAVTVRAGGDARVVAHSVTTEGAFSDGIDARAIDGDTTVVALGSVDTSGYGSHGIDAFSENGHTRVVVASDVTGGSGNSGAGVSFGGGTGALLFNGGSIASLNDRAIVNDGSDSTVWNRGDITGFVDMGAGDDTVRNTQYGRFIARGDSDFGDGEDSFVNAGLVTLAPRSAPASVTIAGLETFDNSPDGVISLQDGQVNDLLRLSDSDYIGGGVLALDAELKGGGTADELHVGGDASGTTVLAVNDIDAGPGDYNPGGVLFARVGGSSDAANFTTNGGVDKGLFRYDAYMKSGSETSDGSNEWYLASTFDREAFEFPIIAAGAQNLWHASTGTWLDRTADLRSIYGDTSSGIVDLKNEGAFDSAGAKVTPGAWMKLLGGTEKRDISNVAGVPGGMSGPSHVYDDVFHQQYLGFMAGVDAGKDSVTANGQHQTWLFGVMAGYVGSNLDFDKSSTDVDYRAGSIGAYATYLNGGFFADAAVKADFGKIDYSSNLGGGFQDDFKSDYTSVGLVVDTGYRFTGNSAWFIEPKATLAYVHTSYDDATVLGTGVDMRNAESLRGRLGARVGTHFDYHGNIVEPWVEASAWHEFKGDYKANLISNGYVAPVGYDLGGTFGEVAGGLTFISTETGWSSFAKGAVQFGSDDQLGFSGNLGIRKAW